MSEARKQRGSIAPHMRHVNLRRIAAYINENLKVANALADYLNELANVLELEHKLMSQHGKNVNEVLDRLKAADAKVASQDSTITEQAATIATLQGQIPDQEDQAADARLTAVLAGQPDPGDPAAQPAAPPTVPVDQAPTPVDATATAPQTVTVQVPDAQPQTTPQA